MGIDLRTNMQMGKINPRDDFVLTSRFKSFFIDFFASSIRYILVHLTGIVLSLSKAFVMSHRVETGRGEERQNALKSLANDFDIYQLRQESVTLSQMDNEYLSSEFPPDLSRYIDYCIDQGASSTKNSVETRIKSTFQVIRETIGHVRLDSALQDHSGKPFADFQKQVLKRVSTELSLQKEMGLRSSDVATCKTLPIVSRMNNNDHRYIIPSAIVSVMHGCHLLVFLNFLCFRISQIVNIQTFTVLILQQRMI
jgi:hypothetical protein